MAAFKILLVEDEAVLALDLTELLEAEGYSVVGPVATGPEALELYRQQPADLLLCDIHLRGPWDGIETARRLTAERPAPVVYLTALADRDTLTRALTTTPAAYLTKPVSLAGLRAAIEVARQVTYPAPTTTAAVGERNGDGPPRESILHYKDHVFLRYNYQFVRLALADIVLLEANNTATTLVTVSTRFSLRLSLSSVLEQLRYAPLVRVHRSFVVNLAHVSAFSDTEAVVQGLPVPLGRQYKADFLRQFHVMV
jgi:DNA-binding LytR/AlgR family response regulator